MTNVNCKRLANLDLTLHRYLNIGRHHLGRKAFIHLLANIADRIADSRLIIQNHHELLAKYVLLSQVHHLFVCQQWLLLK
jgi:hypothetical protein